MKTRFRTLRSVNLAVVNCRRCPRLVDHCTHISQTKKHAFKDWEYWGKPVPGFGDPRARLLIVGLAPAAHGANRTGRMFTGDSSGNWLYEALFRFGFANQSDSLSRDDGMELTDCYITAAARCAPPGNKPTKEEFERCGRYLEADLSLLTNVCVTLALGRLAYQWWLKAAGWWNSLTPGERPQFGHGIATSLPNGTSLITSYHPSRQNTNTRKLTKDMWYDVFRLTRNLLGKRHET